LLEYPKFRIPFLSNQTILFIFLNYFIAQSDEKKIENTIIERVDAQKNDRAVQEPVVSTDGSLKILKFFTSKFEKNKKAVDFKAFL